MEIENLYRTEEIYHVTAGQGKMTLGDKTFEVNVGDSVLILPGTPHCIEACGAVPLKILYCCSPAYDHEDTELLEADVIPALRDPSRHSFR